MRVFLATAMVLITACATGDSIQDQEVAMLAEYGRPQEWVVSDLEAAVDRAGGRVAIGFKNPGEERGVSELGQVLTTPANVAQAKADLRALGLTFTYEFVRIPAVLATISSSQVGAILANPRVQYLEPPSGGSWEVLP
ncbi:MAG: hypothetical protein KF785_13895 [Gemmatimonadales bacterium]|nr:hypothetical protein [Gemmatimonadales bacterium]